ncbi:processed acidic surface protein [Salipaludibacillus sp. CUR1]|uniref:processed acidic surface protein n=1 Tax=Salipaludibacillus sp. CUR1 TaxID=2820003 RepID=UPI001E3B89A4|nr:processed acidic surface protein [Salipaludibacillus sp. CUR1]MCE7793904.1 processed acidic surface protein [Salipaludibacillus sp. CUR1]
MRCYLLLMLFVSAMLFSFLPHVASASVNSQELTVYLKEIGWSQDELDEYLDFEWGLEVKDFESVEELKDFLGDVLTDELIEQLLADYEITRAELHTLLAEYGVTLEEIKFYDDLDFYVWDYYYDEEWDSWDYEEWEFDEDYSDLMDLFAQIGLDEDELIRLFEHLEYVIDNNPDFEDKLDKLFYRLIALGDFDTASELSAEQIAELLAINEELLNLMELEAVFFFVKGEEKKPVTLAELIKVTQLNGFDLLIEIYNLQGEFLADILFTSDMFDSDVFLETADELQTVTEELKEKEPVSDAKPVVNKTEKGGKLPDTATNLPLNMLLGLLAVGTGGAIIRKRKAA